MKRQQTSKPKKAYNNPEFLNSPDARVVRVLAEFIEPAARFRKLRIHDTIVFFGSSRTLDAETARSRLEELEGSLAGKKRTIRDRELLNEAKSALKMSRYYEDARLLAQLLTDWSISLGRGKKRFIVCSGGGPGIMEAANRGATEKKNGYSIGLNISLPFEQDPNPYITRDLNFEFHYFFVRKYWFTYLAKALVVFPGGYGTLDELFETLTLVQTRKTKKKMPVLIYGKTYWKRLIDFDWLVKCGMILKEDLKLFHFCDDPKEAFEYLKAELTSLYLKGGRSRPRR